ncbi:redoxin domain-containing protein [Ferrovibrio sp.]|uniref:TlpA family protein disulfide reductase n=1 Tax=Ferrovibrio sp. TaxID=1917215 RepID=UPI001B6CAB94|nr:redoxin domain-containing protein [Ferrovibrio sp.]MBP7062518.1 redoxin domain-containing protein [Ferrovibrio sp.]
MSHRFRQQTTLSGIDRRLLLQALPASLLGATFIRPAAARDIGLRFGDIFPDVIYRDPSGEKRSIHQLSGTISFVYLWASWCPICADDLVNMEWYYKKYKDNPKFSLVLLNLLDAYDKGVAWAGRRFTMPFSDSGMAAKPPVAAVPGGSYGFPNFTPQFFILNGACEIVHATASRRNGGNDALQVLERELKIA